MAESKTQNYSDDDIRAMWFKAGGRFNGPNVETGNMPEAQLLIFLRGILVELSAANERAGKTKNELVKWNELHKSIAELLGLDFNTWPDHGNVPLAIAASFALRQNEARQAEQSLASARQAAHEQCAQTAWRVLMADAKKKRMSPTFYNDLFVMCSEMREAASLPPTHVRAPVAWRRRENDMWIYYETPAYDDAEPLFAAHGGGGE